MEVAAAPPDAEWDRFCLASPDAWFWHTSGWRDYTVAYRPDLASRSRSFVVTDGGEVVAAVPLMVERHGTATRLSFGGGDCWAPALVDGLTPAGRADALRIALAHVDRVASDDGAVRASFRLSPLSAGGGSCAPFLAETTRAGYADVGAAATVLDLSLPLDAILRGMRKGHRSDIARAARAFTVDITDATTDPASPFEEYRLLHAKAAGRVTRPARTFELMRDWIVHGTGVLLTARLDGVAVSCAYLNVFRDGAYYSSAATDPFIREPAGHLLQWAAVEWLQRRGIRRYELGLQQFGPLPYDVPSAKELNIARFKRGFGGNLVPVPVREKWYDGEAYRALAVERVASYVAALDAGRAVPDAPPP